ncbi:MAG: peptide deformylase [Planctomycetes bacterium]|nr:peptide deformylase [Planctomycetota bacterium]MBL7008668.1 peptide deformylase [Planctomycetota bacterium]
MDIVLYPDPRLRKPNAPVEAFDEELAATARQMFELMYRTKGVGLAAPQVGINLQMMVYNPEGDALKPEGETVLCNPRIVRRAKDKEFEEEGCLSFPGVYAQVQRPASVVVEALNLAGEEFSLELDAWEARIFQHEFDHLDGILFTDRLTPANKTLVKSQLDELETAYRERAQA